MKTRNWLYPMVVSAVVCSAAAFASDAPHDLSTSPSATCDSCHTLHNAPGAAITSVAGNYNLCMSCHSSRGSTFNWPTGYQAQPGTQGRSHRWDAPAVSAEHGAQVPANAAMVKRITGGNLQCSTCHDQHTGANTFKGTQRTSVPVGVAQAHTSGTGTGTLTLLQPLPTATAKGYRIEIVTGGAAGTATFRISNDNATSWFAPTATGAGVQLNDGANVTVTFTGSFVAGDTWNGLYVSYPFLRMSNDSDAMCEMCHVPRVQSSVYVESGGDGVKVFSHPVGEALAHTYDRPVVLDADGSLQTAGDSLKTNNLQLDSLSRVRCTTCHSPHNADSNSLTEDLQ